MEKIDVYQIVNVMEKEHVIKTILNVLEMLELNTYQNVMQLDSISRKDQMENVSITVVVTVEETVLKLL